MLAAKPVPRWLPWLIATAGFFVDIAAWWPGQMSFDSAYAWWQARGGETTTIVSPAMIFVWRVCDAILAGPGLLFALHLALFWSGLALIASALRSRAFIAAAIMFFVAFVPAPFLLRAHVWTDVGLLSTLTFATGALMTALLPELNSPTITSRNSSSSWRIDAASAARSSLVAPNSVSASRSVDRTSRACPTRASDAGSSTRSTPEPTHNRRQLQDSRRDTLRRGPP